MSVSIRWGCLTVRHIWCCKLKLILLRRLGAIMCIDNQLGVNPKALRTWVP